MLKRNGSDIIVSQERYLLPEMDSNEKTKWFIPITYITGKNGQNNDLPSDWLTPSDEYVIIENAVEPNDSIVLNVDRTGYYRVNYDSGSWKLVLFNLINLKPTTRAQIVDDAFYLARANLVEYDVPLTIGLILLRDADDYYSWWAFSDGLKYITNMIKREPAYESFRATVQYLYKQLFEHVGFKERENESHTQILHRAKVVKVACDFGIDRCTNTAQLLYREWMSDRLENK